MYYTLDEIANEIECPYYLLRCWIDDQIDLPDGPQFSAKEAGRIVNRALAAGLREWDADELNVEQEPDYDSMSYREYQKTEHWRDLKVRCLDHHKHQCIFCGYEGRLDMHHNSIDSYKARGREELHQVVPLCRKCHTKFHANCYVK